jgi:hypothetical protein
MDAAVAELERRIAALDWPAIKAAVLELADAPPTPISLAEIEAFERGYGISLPGDYREFLLLIGTNAPGPGEGLVPFRCGFPDEDGRFLEVDDEGWSRLRLPFPGRHPDRGADEDPELGTFDGWLDEGVLPLATNLSDFWAHLVVTGPERGRVWETDGGTFPAPTRLGRPVGFREWYAEWLVDQIDHELPRLREHRAHPDDRFATDDELAPRAPRR